MRAAMAEEPNRFRVKLYQLSEDSHWVDRGTGFVHAEYGDEHALVLVVRSEVRPDANLLEHVVERDIEYQFQDPTIISWTSRDGELALSFQDPGGCEEIWHGINSAQSRTELNLLQGGSDENAPYDVRALCLPPERFPFSLSLSLSWVPNDAARCVCLCPSLSLSLSLALYVLCSLPSPSSSAGVDGALS